jgi:hypothetical protein
VALGSAGDSIAKLQTYGAPMCSAMYGCCAYAVCGMRYAVCRVSCTPVCDQAGMCSAMLLRPMPRARECVHRRAYGAWRRGDRGITWSQGLGREGRKTLGARRRAYARGHEHARLRGTCEVKC